MMGVHYPDTSLVAALADYIFFWTARFLPIQYSIHYTIKYVTDTSLSIYFAQRYLYLHPGALAITPDTALAILAAIPNLGRVALAAVFAGSYIMMPLHKVILTLWARIVESEKPVFTLMFSGGAAAAKGIEAIIRAL
jgi:hypothetical protein